MKDLMNSIMAIDHAANDRLNEAIREKEVRLQEIAEAKIKLSKQIEEYANSHLSELDESERISAQESILEIKADVDAEQNRLQAIYDENHETWVSSLVKNVLSHSNKTES